MSNSCFYIDIYLANYVFFLLREMLGPKPVFRPKIPSTTSDTSDLDIGTLSSLTLDTSQTTFVLIQFQIEEMQLLLALSGASPPESPSITETSINYIQLDLDNTG